MESNRFMLECTSICPETTHQKLESQRVYFFIKLWINFVCDVLSEDLEVGVASTRLQFPRKTI